MTHVGSLDGTQRPIFHRSMLASPPALKAEVQLHLCCLSPLSLSQTLFLSLQERF